MYERYNPFSFLFVSARKGTKDFPEKHVRVFPETRTRICENTYVFWETDNEVLNAFGKMYNNYVENKHCIPF